MTDSENARQDPGVSHDVSDIKSKISAAKHELESAARWTDDAEQRKIYEHHAKELGVAKAALNDVRGEE